MKKSFLVLLVLIFLFSSQVPSNAATKTLKAGQAVTLTYPTTVTLKKSGCQRVSFRYSVGKMPSFAYLAILDDADDQIGGDFFYQTPDWSAGKIWKKNSSFNLKVCRSDWSRESRLAIWSRDDSEGIEDMTPVKKGTYQLYLLVHQSAEVFGTITFK